LFQVRAQWLCYLNAPFVFVALQGFAHSHLLAETLASFGVEKARTIGDFALRKQFAKSVNGQRFSCPGNGRQKGVLYRIASKIPENGAVKQAVETYVDHRLNFPRAQEMLDLIHVEFDYYDISDELLSKEDFAEMVERFDIEVRDYKEGYEKNKQVNLFEFSG